MSRLKSSAGWLTYIGVTIATLTFLAKIASALVGFGIQFATFQSNMDSRLKAMEAKLDRNEEHITHVDNRVTVLEHDKTTNRN